MANNRIPHSELLETKYQILAQYDFDSYLFLQDMELALTNITCPYWAALDIIEVTADNPRELAWKKYKTGTAGAQLYREIKLYYP